MIDDINEKEKFLKQVFKSTQLDSPSADFTEDLMSKIHALDSTESVKYSPIIPNSIMVGLGFVFVGVLIYLIVNPGESSISLLSHYLNISEMPFKFKFSEFQYSFMNTNIVSYAAILFLSMFAYQVYLIKKKFISP